MATLRNVVAEAIETSISEDRVVRIRLSDLPDGATIDGVLDELRGRWDFGDDVDNGPEYEAWGGSGANEWRVHVVR